VEKRAAGLWNTRAIGVFFIEHVSDLAQLRFRRRWSGRSAHLARGRSSPQDSCRLAASGHPSEHAATISAVTVNSTDSAAPADDAT
jgi:hypothetical protein